MDRSWLYRVLLYTLLTVASVVVLAPSVAAWLDKEDALPEALRKRVDKKIMLGLDLQGGLHLVYEVQVDKAVSDKADRLASDIEEKLRKEKKVKEVRLEREASGDMVATFKEPADAAKLDREFLKDYRKY